ncbi:MAG: TetR/AcrR family transcriptional regulator [Treponema sp.]|nr:TetR/AcrR family transcriptional regulator [Treponema sp.]
MNRREKQKAETFTDIMRAAEGLFMEQGYERTSMQQIADRSGVTKGALYHHFDSKDALLERMCADHYLVLEHAARPIVEDKTLSCFERIRQAIELSRGMGISTVSFVSEYLKTHQDDWNRGGGVMLKDRLRLYDKKFYAKMIGPLLSEARTRGECDFSAQSDVLAVFMHQLDRGVDEEINRAFSEYGKHEAEKRIVDIMKTYVFILSRMLSIKPDEVSQLISLEESMHLYGEVLKAKLSREGSEQ